MKQAINITVNGKAYRLEVKVSQRLLDVIRDELGLLGTKEGCGAGECGACTVIMNGEAVNSCLVLAVQADGAEILTIEGLAQDGELHPLQKAFIEHGAIQCGFCTPGMVMSAKAFFDEHKGQKITREKVKEGISGNLCRCTGYQKIIEAIMDYAEKNED